MQYISLNMVISYEEDNEWVLEPSIVLRAKLLFCGA